MAARPEGGGRRGQAGSAARPPRPDAGTALWAQVSDSLRQRLADGELSERVPTEAELTAQYGVSRATVREAIRRLRAEGLLEARQGAGTFVLKRELDEPLLGRLGLARMIERAGFDERSRLLRAEAVDAGPGAAAALSCEPGAPAARIDRLRFAGDEAIALDRCVFLVGGEARRKVLAAPLDHGSLYDVLATRAGVRVDAGRELVRAVAGTAADRRLLALGPGDGLLELERCTYAGGSPVEWRRTLLKGSHYAFGTSWGSPPGPGGRA
ncbi:MAG: GntR family transcriptional regulator [Acidimicrobiales bacterium]